METSEAKKVHPWERAGLGLAPFRWTGVTIESGGEGKYRQVVNGVEFTSGAPGQPMGTCAYCLQGIKECHHIVSSDGRKFTVGCDCVKRVEDEGSRVLSLVERAHRELNRKTKQKRDAVKIAEGLAWFETVKEAAASKPHPNKTMASRGRTLADYFVWMQDRAGTTGKLEAIKTVKKALLDE